MKFAEDMKKIAYDLEISKGYNILQCVYCEDNIVPTEDELLKLEDAHYRKIDLSDGIYVVNMDGYIGTSVKKEIEYIDKESVFIADLKKFLDRISIYHTKYTICEWASFAFFLVLGLYPIFIPFNGNAYYQTARGVFPVMMGILLSEAISIGLYYLCSKLIWKKLFPRAIYAWGEETESYSRLEKLRSNLFWGVLIATVISVVVGLILK